jgi:hypothetical protein
VTVDPREIVCGLGEYAVVVSPVAPATIEIDGPPGDPDEGVVTVALSLPQAAQTDRRAAAAIRRQAMEFLLVCLAGLQGRCRGIQRPSPTRVRASGPTAVRIA